ncbi:hypothetical protein [Alkalicoccus halolimnae]|uniref:Uncharacterized protein n=1 Tax=Alkalicoccus halolimnae TaxID=1667239 RepID=A0A5C7FCT5_9BACI|nr:hypothetical protein [Alkalicoccus halolimnae]TXF82711.1 hypothetical protein FTX54_13855 [Alkalicoccus halolimnae]
MEIQTLKFEPRFERQRVYYPNLLTVWTASYRSVFGIREEKVALMTNLVKGGSGFVSSPPTVKMKALPGEVLPGIMSVEEAEEEAHETMRRHYLHKARSWNVPTFIHHKTEKIYVPYEYFLQNTRWLKKERMYLHEPVSQYEDRLKKYPEIEAFIQMKEGIS